ncbi:MAG TPA: hypothetical protein VJI98_00545 [Candidatus Nanoarchaeia archaeon]|nr:hypothetical protein [Candidatus Nanoarchaeia archaeon]
MKFEKLFVARAVLGVALPATADFETADVSCDNQLTINNDAIPIARAALNSDAVNTLLAAACAQR